MEPAVKQKLKILVVDDNKNMAGLVKALIEECCNQEAEEVFSSESATEKLNNGGYDLAFIDYNLGKVNTTGLEIIRERKRNGDKTGLYLMYVNKKEEKKYNLLNEKGPDGFLQVINTKIIEDLKSIISGYQVERN